MPIRSRENLYRGVNAHLHSLLQQDSVGWQSFHSAHIIDLARVLDAALPAGYRAVPERSLQIRQIHPDTGERVIDMRPRTYRPDVSVYRQPGEKSAPAEPLTLPPPTLRLLNEDVINDPEAYLTAVAIRENTASEIGQVIGWIELLSPTNKPTGDGYAQYRRKREDALKTGLVLIEVDYLHQTSPVDNRIPSYPYRESGAYPYLILLSDPRPTIEHFETLVYGFRVDVPIPTLRIPLLAGESVALDFDAAYQNTYTSLKLYSDLVDYEQLPANFPAYDPNDQERIRARMQAAAQAIRSSESAGDS